MSSFKIGDMRVEIPRFDDGQIHHLAATWDGADLVIYIDGDRQ